MNTCDWGLCFFFDVVVVMLWVVYDMFFFFELCKLPCIQNYNP